jgi:hypothetical protein
MLVRVHIYIPQRWCYKASPTGASRYKVGKYQYLPYTVCINVRVSFSWLRMNHVPGISKSLSLRLACQ